MSSYRVARTGADESDEAKEYPPLPCSWCRTLTAVLELSMHGARCKRCFKAYCEAQTPDPIGMSDKRKDGPRAWVHGLKARDESGEGLSKAQRDMWRSALNISAKADA